MQPAHSIPKADVQQPSRTFLIGLKSELEGIIKCCPTASSLLCRELATGRDALIAIPCKRWGCHWCGQRNAFRLAIKVQLAKPTKFITLTVNPAHYSNPREAYDKTRRKISDLAKTIRFHADQFEYVRVLEVTKKGWPHYHLVARCPFIKQTWLSDQWATATGAAIVDIRQIKQTDNVFKYMLKYLCKQTYIPWTNRRVCWSKDFFPKPSSEPRQQNPFVNRRRYHKHPVDSLSELYQNHRVQEIRPGIWIID